MGKIQVQREANQRKVEKQKEKKTEEMMGKNRVTETKSHLNHQRIIFMLGQEGVRQLIVIVLLKE